MTCMTLRQSRARLIPFAPSQSEPIGLQARRQQDSVLTRGTTIPSQRVATVLSPCVNLRNPHIRRRIISALGVALAVCFVAACSSGGAVATTVTLQSVVTSTETAATTATATISATTTVTKTAPVTKTVNGTPKATGSSFSPDEFMCAMTEQFSKSAGELGADFASEGVGEWYLETSSYLTTFFGDEYALGDAAT